MQSHVQSPDKPSKNARETALSKLSLRSAPQTRRDAPSQTSVTKRWQKAYRHFSS